MLEQKLDRIIELLEALQPKKIATRKKQKWPTKEAWDIYTAHFWKRYSVAPKRNQTVNSQMVNFVKRVGPDDAPAILAFYLSCPDDWYTRNMHSLGLLLKEAEKMDARWRAFRQEYGYDTFNMVKIKKDMDVLITDTLRDIGDLPDEVPDDDSVSFELVVGDRSFK